MLLVKVTISSPAIFHNGNVNKEIGIFLVNFLGKGDSIET